MGFTLIEILIVLAIIAVTTGILVITSVQTQMKKSRDMQRKTDMVRIRTALEMYKTDNNVYPKFWGTDYGWNFASNLTPLSSGNYLNPLPKDPTLGDTCPGYLVALSAQGYTIYVGLENANDPDALIGKPTPVYLPGGTGLNGAKTAVTISGGTCGGFTYNYWINNR